MKKRNEQTLISEIEEMGYSKEEMIAMYEDYNRMSEELDSLKKELDMYKDWHVEINQKLDIKRACYEMYKLDWLRRISSDRQINTYRDYLINNHRTLATLDVS